MTQAQQEASTLASILPASCRAEVRPHSDGSADVIVYRGAGGEVMTFRDGQPEEWDRLWFHAGRFMPKPGAWGQKGGG